MQNNTIYKGITNFVRGSAQLSKGIFDAGKEGFKGYETVITEVEESKMLPPANNENWIHADEYDSLLSKKVQLEQILADKLVCAGDYRVDILEKEIEGYQKTMLTMINRLTELEEEFTKKSSESLAEQKKAQKLIANTSNEIKAYRKLKKYGIPLCVVGGVLLGSQISNINQFFIEKSGHKIVPVNSQQTKPSEPAKCTPPHC